MFVPFFENLRKASVPVSLREYLGFLEGMSAGLATYDAEAFYYLARTSMVKEKSLPNSNRSGPSNLVIQRNCSLKGEPSKMEQLLVRSK